MNYRLFKRNNCEFKTKMPDNVLLKDYTKYIKSKKEKILTEKEVANIIEGITAYRLPNNSNTKRKHVQHVKIIKQNKHQT